jgi:hypothetical protein
VFLHEKQGIGRQTRGFGEAGKLLFEGGGIRGRPVGDFKMRLVVGVLANERDKRFITPY